MGSGQDKTENFSKDWPGKGHTQAARDAGASVQLPGGGGGMLPGPSDGSGGLSMGGIGAGCTPGFEG